MVVLRRMINNYRQGMLSLNTLIQRIEGVSDLLGVEAWKVAVFPLISSMEQVNATAIDAKRDLSVVDQASILSSLVELDAVINQFDIKDEGF
jgi:hypothetical protein